MAGIRMSRRPRPRAAALLVSILAGAAAVPAGPAAAAAGTDLERPVAAGDRLEIRNYAGSVVVSTWGQDRVRIQAEHPESESIVARKHGATLRVVPLSWERDSGEFAVRLPDTVRIRHAGRPPPPVALRLRVPEWLPVTVEMPYGDVTIAGTEAAVAVTVLAGDIEVSGAGSPVSLVALSGEMALAGADGRLTLEGARGGITVRDCGGDLRVETTTGDVRLEDLRTESTEVGSLAGAIVYRGRLHPGGTYELSTHSGDITLELPPGEPDARFSARSLEGGIDADLAAAPAADPHRLGVTTGDGSARVRLWSFTGTISIRRR